jgi:hypothetical protein
LFLNKIRWGVPKGYLPSCYLGGMRFDYTDERLEIPLEDLPRAANERRIAKGAEEVERRGKFVSAYLAGGRRDGRGERLDPVLEFHLGLQKPQA